MQSTKILRELKPDGKGKVLHFHRSGPYIVLVGNARLILGYGMASKILVKKE
jgi:Fe2+ transport system protein FeoA